MKWTLIGFGGLMVIGGLTRRPADKPEEVVENVKHAERADAGSPAPKEAEAAPASQAIRRPLAGRYERDVDEDGYRARGLQWPFTVSKGRIGCERSFAYFESGGTRYAINGRSRAKWPYVEPLLRVDDAMKSLPKMRPDEPPIRIDPRDVRAEALALCEEEARG